MSALAVLVGGIIRSLRECLSDRNFVQNLDASKFMQGATVTIWSEWCPFSLLSRSVIQPALLSAGLTKHLCRVCIADRLIDSLQLAGLMFCLKAEMLFSLAHASGPKINGAKPTNAIDDLKGRTTQLRNRQILNS